MAEDLFKLEFYVPSEHLEQVKAALFAAGAGRLGNYDCCCWHCAGVGQFRPLPGSNPFIGGCDQVEKVPEYKVETVCKPESIDAVIAALLESHPYETPAYQYWPVKG